MHEPIRKNQGKRGWDGRQEEARDRSEGMERRADEEARGSKTGGGRGGIVYASDAADGERRGVASR